MRTTVRPWPSSALSREITTAPTDRNHRHLFGTAARSGSPTTSRQNHNHCTLARWHQPLLTAATTFGDGNGVATRPLWDTLYKYGADLVLNGHDHNYQRFTPQRSDGTADPAYGMREFSENSIRLSARTLGTVSSACRP
jgi:hypothetical protein